LDDPSVSSWPALVADRLGVELVNLAKPAYSNDAILQDMVAQDINQSSYTDLVIVCWTTYLRMQYVDQAGWFTLWPGRDGNTQKSHTKFDSLREQMIKSTAYLNNDDWLYSRWLTQTILLQNHLESLHAKYLFFSAFDNQQQYKRKSKTHAGLLAKVKADNFIGWPEQGFSEWAYPCDLGPRMHPLEQGHAKVADKVLDALAKRYDIR
jgi:hypothetical protein